VLKDIFNSHRAWIVFTYVVTVLEFAFFGMLPFLLGRAVDALLTDHTEDFVLYVSCCVTGLVIGFIRRRMDTRVFMNIWRLRAVSSIGGMMDRGVKTTKLFSRVDLVKRYPDFFEFTIPMTVSAVMEIAIASVMIYLVVPWVGLIITALAILAVVSTYLFSRLMRSIEVRMQGVRERRDDALNQRNLDGVANEYVHLQKDWIIRSDLDAYCWGICDLLGILAEVILIVAIVKENVTVGTILASVTYCGKMFIQSGFLAYFFNHIQEIIVADKYLSSN
jgi:membrane protein implicated in regulation of membrane protease activity